MVGMTKVQEPQYGSTGLLVLVSVVPVTLVFSLWSAVGGVSPSAPAGVFIGMLILAWWVRRSSVVSVDDAGVVIKTVAGRLTIPWTEIERLDGHRLSARLLRRSNGKRVFVQMLDPNWSNRPVSRAIHAHLATATPVVQRPHQEVEP